MDYFEGSVPGTRLSESQRKRLGTNWSQVANKTLKYDIAAQKAREQAIIQENERLKYELMMKEKE